MHMYYQKNTEQLNKIHKYKAIWHRAVFVLSCIVVFCTVYALILPAITLEGTRDTYCGYEYEHKHDIVRCYEIPGVEEHTEILCTAQNCLHEHTEDCYNANGELVCGEADFLIHVHDEYCYDDDEKLICTLTEIKEHKHTEACYENQTVLACSEKHMHSAQCYSVIKSCVCGNEEVVAHTHVATCYDAQDVLICTKLEVKKHTHTEACVKQHIDAVEPQNLICGKTEHTHTEACFVSTASDTAETLFAVCTCDNSQLTVSAHSDSCEYKSSVKLYAQQNSAQELYTHWNAFSSDEQSYILDYLSWSSEFANKLQQLNYYLENGANVTLDAVTKNGTTVNISSELLPLDTEIELTQPAYIKDRIYEIFDPNIVNDIRSWYVYDIGLTSNGEKYEPSEGTKITVSVTSADFTVADDEYFGIAHLNEATGEIISNTYVELTDGTATFETDSFSPFVFYTVSKEIYGGERNWGKNWITLRDNGWYTYWEQFLDNDVEAQAYGSLLSSSAVSSADQIIATGGYVNNPNNDGVSVGKVIKGTSLENIFDITLTVETTTNIESVTLDPDMAVVIVLDISNTMLEDYGNGTKYSAAMEAAEAFVWNFAAETKSISKIGFVAFNTNATKICDMQSINTGNAAAYCNTMRTQTGSIINADGYGSSSVRYTNMEAGLKMASDMLANTSNKNQYVIFLTDGLPTTYIKTGYTGYEPKSSSGTVNNDGVFYDRINKKYCQYGVNYSDKAATKAETVAKNMKASGITIYSVGMAVDNFYATHGSSNVALNSSDFINDQLARGAKAKVTYTTGASYTYTGYAVSTIDNNRNVTYANWNGTLSIGNVKNTTSAFHDWMRGSTSAGIASGYYYNASDSNALISAFDAIFEALSQKIQETFATLWVTKDMIPVIAKNGCIEFISFLENGALAGKVLNGEYKVGGGNTAEYDTTVNTVIWDLKKSGYTTDVSGNTTIYKYSLVYRVRLVNEAEDFVQNTEYVTNGEAFLTYNTVTTINGESVISANKQIGFPVPSVKGYLVELSFKKQNDMSQPLSGAGFTLMHDDENCEECHGDNTCVAMPKYTAVADENGVVYFKDIPSGHKYILTETTVPDGYRPDGNTYSVTAAYGDIAVSVYRNGVYKGQWNMDGSDTIVDPAGYELPSTGGNGNTVFIAVGLTLMLCAVVTGVALKRKRSRDK